MKLEVHDLHKSFQGKEVLHGISFTIESGKALGLLGRNGAGKSTTIRILMDVFKANQGTLLMDGKPFHAKEYNIGYLPEERGLYPKKKVSEQLLYLAELRGMKKAEAKSNLKKWLKRLHIEEYESRVLETLSKGNQQKVQLAQTLMNDPDIVILDEPFSALDYHLRSNMENELCEILKDFNGNVLFVTHDISEAYRVSDEIIVFDNGLSLPKKSKDKLFAHPSCMTEAVITGCKNISACDIIDIDTVFAKDWGFKCKLDKGVNKDSKYIGIRAHHMKVVEEEVENGENLFEMTVVRVIENSFSYNIHIKNCDNENNLPLQMEVDKNIKKVKVGQTIKVKFEQNSVFDF